jgi:hypothetical protein
MHNPELKQDYESSHKLVERKREVDRLRALLLEGRESPLGSEPMDAAYFEKLRNQIREKADRNK